TEKVNTDEDEAENLKICNNGKEVEICYLVTVYDDDDRFEALMVANIDLVSVVED
ncbi:hypothetical protein A2U01_0083237, partial [Trifolium medium]|nr:hypothetical protein [Trifolium medium]